MTTTRARPLTNAERQRRYRARRAAEYRQAVAEGRTLLHQYCRELVGDPDRAGWLVAHGMTLKRCRFVEEYIAPRLRYRDIRNAALAYRLDGYAPRWSTVLGPKLRRVDHLRAWIAYSNRDDTLSFWRTRAGNEVDFVLYGGSGLYAIEVKSSATLHPRDFSGLRAFTEDYPVATPVLLYRGPRRIRERGVLCLPCEPFLRTLTPSRSFADILATVRTDEAFEHGEVSGNEPGQHQPCGKHRIGLLRGSGSPFPTLRRAIVSSILRPSPPSVGKVFAWILR